MGVSLKLFRLARLEYETTGFNGTFQLHTDLPGNYLALRETIALPPTSTRESLTFALKGTTKGRIFKVRVSPGSVGEMRLYAVSLYMRKMGRASSDWFWHEIQVEPSSDAWIDLKLPIPATPDEYTNLKLPIDPTSDEYTLIHIPMKPTPDELMVASLPVDQ